MRTRDLTDLVLLASIWGASYLFMRVATPEFGAIALIEVRVLVAAVVLMPFFLAREKLYSVLQYWREFLIVGAMNSAIPFCLIAYATLQLSAGYAGVLNASAPLFGAVIAVIWLGEYLDGSRRVGLALGFLGVFVLAWPEIDSSPGPATMAVAAVILAASCYGWCASYMRLHTGHIETLTKVTGSMVGASILLAPPAIWTWPENSISVQSWLAVAALGAVCTGVAYLLYFRLISSIGASQAISVTYMVPAFAVLWGMLFLDEQVTLLMLIGSAVILGGTALATGAFSLARFRPTGRDT